MPIVYIILSLIGIADTAYLTFISLFNPQWCGEGAGVGNCGAVLMSPYAHMLGIPLASLGLGVFLALFYLALKRLTHKEAVSWILPVTAAASAVAVILILIQAVVIREWCPFCLLSSATFFLLFGLALYDGKRHSQPLFPATVSSSWLATVLVLLIVPSLIYVTMEFGMSFRGAQTSSAPENPVVARFGDRVIRLSELDDALVLKRQELDQNLHESRLRWLERELLREAASRENKTISEFLNARYDAITVTDQEIRRFYDENTRQMGGRTLAETKESILHYLINRKKQLLYTETIQKLLARPDMAITLPTPNSLVLDPNPRKGPEKGNPEAPVTMVKFTDFQCHYCKEAHHRLKTIMADNPGALRIIYRHYPLTSVHPEAAMMAEAAVCAHRQEKFWPYADLLFEHQDAIDEDRLLRFAFELGLDTNEFKQCLISGEGTQVVSEDVLEGQMLGVSSTPTFFINGIKYQGLPPESVFQEHLKRKK